MNKKNDFHKEAEKEMKKLANSLTKHFPGYETHLVMPETDKKCSNSGEGVNERGNH